MPFTLRYMYVKHMVTSVLQDQKYMFGVRSLLVDEKVLLMKRYLADVLFRRLMQRSQNGQNTALTGCVLCTRDVTIMTPSS